MTNFGGKKLLILGANTETAVLVKTAQKMGVFVIVTDYAPDAPAKKIADKAYNVDGFDVDGLVELIKKENVDGVLVGVADSLIEKYQQVCERLNLPCYATHEQVKYFTNKFYFKNICSKFEILGVPEYNLEEKISENEYPIVIKPADSNSGNGITVVRDSEELKSAVEKAMSFSRMKKVIAEKYMADANDVSIYYTFQNGKYYLSSISDRYTSDEQGNFSRVCLGDVFPSHLIHEFIKNEHPKYEKMFESLKCKNGVLYISAFYENGKFYVYDPGFRLQGGGFHIIVDSVCGFDHRKMLIQFALTGQFGDKSIQNLNDPFFGGKSAAVIWFLLKQGEIASISGFDSVESNLNVFDFVKRFEVGDVVRQEFAGTEKQVFARIYLKSDNDEKLKNAIIEIENKLIILDENGNNMLYKPLNINKINI